MNWKVFYDANLACTEVDSHMKSMEVRALLLIYRYPGILQSEVRAKLQIHPARMNRMATHLSDVNYKSAKRECLGLITLHEVADDRRCKGLSLTAKGMAMIHKMERTMKAAE
ncbi:MAG: hypothetical protein COB54_07620 [Alphaproteobacteria bacterium]|nr:MAG: hypothetical protein COB54_07620 [Alphaproteobacteria bacterium]